MGDYICPCWNIPKSLETFYFQGMPLEMTYLSTLSKRYGKS